MTDAHKVEAVKMLASACGHQGMVLGQQYDLDAEKNELLDIELIHSLKTAKLIQVALTMPYLGNPMYKTTTDVTAKCFGWKDWSCVSNYG